MAHCHKVMKSSLIRYCHRQNRCTN